MTSEQIAAAIASRPTVDTSWLSKKPTIIRAVEENPPPKRLRRGKPAVVDDFPTIVPVAENFIASNGFRAHRRRRETTGTCGSTMPEVKDHCLDTIPHLRTQYPKLNVRTVARLMQPPHKGRRNASSYKGLIDARVATKDNSDRNSNTNSQFYSARVKYCLEMASRVGEKALIYSADNKNKVRVSDNSLAVDRRITIRRFFPTDDAPVYLDHDFPTPGYTLTPAGYLEQLPSPGFTEDNIGRQHHVLPKNHKASVILRSPHSVNNIASHLNDLSTLINADKKMLLLLVDGGPDFNSNHATNAFYYGRFFRDCNLDAMLVTSYCPGDSAYNPIEHVWAPCTEALTGVYLPSSLPNENKPPCHQSIPADQKLEKEHEVFNRAMESVRDGYWKNLKFSGEQVAVRVEPSGGDMAPYGGDYINVKQKVTGSAMQLSRSGLKEEYQFIHQHVDKRIGMLVFTKCVNLECTHCRDNPPTISSEDMSLLRNFPSPSPSTDHPGHYLTFLEAISHPAVPPCHHMPTFEEKGLGRCQVDGCRYVFNSKKDANDHRLKVHK